MFCVEQLPPTAAIAPSRAVDHEPPLPVDQSGNKQRQDVARVPAGRSRSPTCRAPESVHRKQVPGSWHQPTPLSGCSTPHQHHVPRCVSAPHQRTPWNGSRKPPRRLAPTIQPVWPHWQWPGCAHRNVKPPAQQLAPLPQQPHVSKRFLPPESGPTAPAHIQQ